MMLFTIGRLFFFLQLFVAYSLGSRNGNQSPFSMDQLASTLPSGGQGDTNYNGNSPFMPGDEHNSAMAGRTRVFRPQNAQQQPRSARPSERLSAANRPPSRPSERLAAMPLQSTASMDRRPSARLQASSSGNSRKPSDRLRPQQPVPSPNGHQQPLGNTTHFLTVPATQRQGTPQQQQQHLSIPNTDRIDQLREIPFHYVPPLGYQMDGRPIRPPHPSHATTSSSGASNSSRPSDRLRLQQPLAAHPNDHLHQQLLSIPATQHRGMPQQQQMVEGINGGGGSSVNMNVHHHVSASNRRSGSLIIIAEQEPSLLGRLMGVPTRIDTTIIDLD